MPGTGDDGAVLLGEAVCGRLVQGDLPGRARFLCPVQVRVQVKPSLSSRLTGFIVLSAQEWAHRLLFPRPINFNNGLG